MQDFVNFLNNLRNSQQEVGQKVNKAANEMTNYVVNGIGNAANQSWNAVTAPVRYIGNEFSNAANAVGQGMGQAWSNFNRDVTIPTGQKMMDVANTVNNAVGLGNNGVQRQATPTATVNTIPTASIDGSGVTNQINNPTTQALVGSTTTNAANALVNNAPATSGSKTYQRDPGIDTFVSALRFFTNPIRGITGETPLDILANQVSDAMYTTFGKEIPASKTETNSTATETKTSDTSESAAKAESTPTESESDVVTYTYKPGDTFGQVLLNLGLNTGNGLWGSGGDVEYYTRQLMEQGALDRYGNVPIGTTIKLKRRKLNDLQ